MYTISILWYLAWPVLIMVATVIILVSVNKFDKDHTKISES